MKILRDRIYNIISTFFLVAANQSSDAYVELDKAIDEAFQSFGGCDDCYGKGYLAEISSDHQEVVLFCTCDRGKQLKRLIESNYLAKMDNLAWFITGSCFTALMFGLGIYFGVSITEKKQEDIAEKFIIPKRTPVREAPEPPASGPIRPVSPKQVEYKKNQTENDVIRSVIS